MKRTKSNPYTVRFRHNGKTSTTSARMTKSAASSLSKKIQRAGAKAKVVRSNPPISTPQVRGMIKPWLTGNTERDAKMLRRTFPMVGMSLPDWRKVVEETNADPNPPTLKVRK